jgi:phosphopantothenoylcysteine decarboxylase/phosphopantothenate--cysteine ligase
MLLGVSGIAAYKTASLVRFFIKAGAHVQVIMTPASKDFVTHLHYPHYLKTCLL